MRAYLRGAEQSNPELTPDITLAFYKSHPSLPVTQYFSIAAA
jgi:hypothetical protein